MRQANHCHLNSFFAPKTTLFSPVSHYTLLKMYDLYAYIELGLVPFSNSTIVSLSRNEALIWHRSLLSSGARLLKQNSVPELAKPDPT
jgi:hypothetical protein